eukprot:Skav221022  [mRNA]  locus=scaffold576:9721:10623:+ [translate_table: standard]
MPAFDRKAYIERLRAKDAPAEDTTENGKAGKPKAKAKAKAKAKQTAKAKAAKAKAKQTAKAKAAKAKAAPKAPAKHLCESRGGTCPSDRCYPNPLTQDAPPHPEGPALSAILARPEPQENPPSSPPPLPPPASPPSGCEELLPPHFLYFQRQQQAHCGMHALNNALGRAAFTPENMAEAAAQYLQEHVGIDEALDEHIRPGGWYSAQVLYAALFVQGYGLNLDEPVRTIEQARATPSMVQNWGGRHWVVYRRGPTGKLFLLDSLQRGPKEVSEQQLLESLARCWTYAVANPDAPRNDESQ